MHKKKFLIVHYAPLCEWKSAQKALVEYGHYLSDGGYDVIFLNNTEFVGSQTEIKLKTERKIKFKVLDVRFRKRFGRWVVSRKGIERLNPDIVHESTFNVFAYMPF